MPVRIDIEAATRALDGALMRECQHPKAGNNACGRVIGAHTVPRNALSRMAQDGHVWQITVDDLLAVYKDEPTRVKAKKIGVKKASTLPIFCDFHDKTFGPIENGAVLPTAQNAFLFHYRAMVRRRVASEYAWRGFEVAWNKIAALPEHIGKAAREQLAFTGINYHRSRVDNLMFKAECDAWLTSGDFSNVGAVFVELDDLPHFMCCGSVVPDYDFNGAPLHGLAHPLTAASAMDPVACTLIGTERGGLAVLSWAGPGLAAKRFVESFMRIRDDRKGRAIERLVASLIENYYVAPAWWSGRSDAERHSLSAAYARRLEHHVPQDCLASGDDEGPGWRVRSVTEIWPTS